MNISRLRLVTFDVTNTLLKFRTEPGKQYGEIGAIYGIIGDNNTLSRSFKAHWKKMNKEHPNFGLNTGLGWEKWWRILVKSTFTDSKLSEDDKKLEAVANHLIEAYKTSTCWQQSYGALGLLSYIRSRGIPMGVISNFDPRLDATLVNTKLRHYFQFIVTSYEAGIEKPDPKIFKEAMILSKLEDLKAEECLHVGDRPLLDYCGARNSDWCAALIDDRNPEMIAEKYPQVDVKHLFASLYHLHKYFVDTFDQKITSHCL